MNVYYLSSGGFVGIFNLFSAYEKWCRTTSARAQYFEKMLEMCDMIEDPDCPKSGRHRELDSSVIRKSEKAVQDTITAINNFTNPFKIADKEKLYSLASGAPVTSANEKDVLGAEALGKANKEAFKKRFCTGSTTTYYDPITREKLLTMEANNKIVNISTRDGKVNIKSWEIFNLSFICDDVI